MKSSPIPGRQCKRRLKAGAGWWVKWLLASHSALSFCDSSMKTVSSQNRTTLSTTELLPPPKSFFEQPFFPPSQAKGALGGCSLLWLLRVCPGMFFAGSSGHSPQAGGKLFSYKTANTMTNRTKNCHAVPLPLVPRPLEGIRPSFLGMTSRPWGCGLFN